MNAFGLISGLAAFVIIGLGFPLVIRGERRFGYVLWPYFFGTGILLVGASLLAVSDWLSLVMGASGATMIWGSTELKEQAIRAELGWFPFNEHKQRVPFAGTIKKWRAPTL
jgi:hypothetical protein